jgi:glycosyltransferase involved in cell wall biosynthesis
MKINTFWLFIFFSAVLATEKKLFVIIPSYNNETWAEKNILSVLNQKYSNFEGIFVNDCSLDKTGTIVQNTLQKYDPMGKIEYVKNMVHRGKAANLWFTLHGFNAKKKIGDDDIVVILDGDDWYAHDMVFLYLNNLYTSSDIWFTYGGFFTYPPQPKEKIFPIVPMHVVEKNLFRFFGGCGSQQRTFYAWLYRRIKLSDLFFTGKFMPCAGDIAKVIPMMEMAGPRFKHIDEKIYVYNRANALNDDKVSLFQGVIDRYVRRQLPQYDPLVGREPRVMSGEKVDVICLVDRRLLGPTASFVENLKNNVQNINNIRMVDVILGDKQTFKERFLQACALSSDYICVITNFDICDIPRVDLMNVKQILWKTQALAYYLKLNDKTVITFEKLANGVNAVQNCSATGFSKNCEFNFQVFETAILKKLLEKIDFVDVSTLLFYFKRLPEMNIPYAMSLFLEQSAQDLR